MLVRVNLVFQGERTKPHQMAETCHIHQSILRWIICGVLFRRYEGRKRGDDEAAIIHWGHS